MSNCICLKICGQNPRDRSQTECNECSICMDALTDKEIIKLRCGHFFHPECIKDWRRGSMESNTKCPLYRASFTENEINPQLNPSTPQDTNNNEECNDCSICLEPMQLDAQANNNKIIKLH